MGEEKRAVAVRDCISVKKVVWQKEVRISPNGRRVAYVLKAPNLITNQNDYQLLVRDLNHTAERESGSLVFHSQDLLSGLGWLADGKRVVLIARIWKDRSKILIINTETRETETVVEVPNGIGQYSINATGDVVAYTATSAATPATQSAERNSYGFSIPPSFFLEVLAQRRPGFSFIDRVKITVMIRQTAGKWDSTTVPSPAVSMSHSAENPNGFRGIYALEVSPDGNSVAFIYQVHEIPKDWEEHRKTQRLRSVGINPIATALYNSKTRRVGVPFGFPDARQIWWAGDSKAFAILAAAPVKSVWDKEDAEAHVNEDLGKGFHLFAVEAQTHTVSEVLSPSKVEEGATVVDWKKMDGEMLVKVGKDNLFMDMKPAGQEWEEVNHFNAAVDGGFDSVTTNDGEVLVGIEEAPAVPPDLALYNAKTKKATRLTDLNPQISELSLGQIDKLEWTTSYGAKAQGHLIKPVGYEQGRKYPLVIMLTWPSNSFVCDGHYATAFPPQPLANAGFLVLVTNSYDPTPEHSGPGETATVREAEGMQATVEAAVNLLADQGLADPADVGIIGFSRSSWKVDYILTHSKFKFRAASSADSGIYNYGGYWLFDGAGFQQQWTAAYGGPPYGATLQSWIKYAPPFNADKVQSPLLMEYTGEAGMMDQPQTAYEFHVALRTLGKPVDLFFYPKADHPLDTPFERVASLQRNVDWFRFWMQNYEGKAPDYDPDQYVRWRKLREQQRWNDRTRAEGKDPTSEFLKQTAPGAIVSDGDRAPAVRELIH